MITKLYNLLLPPIKDITYIGNLPNDVDNCVALIEDGGKPNIYFHNLYMGQPILKVVVRHISFEEGRQIVKAFKKTFKAYSNAEFDMVLISEPIYFGRDDKHRNVWQLTFKIINKEE